jgi:STE24 endopeptidase
MNEDRASRYHRLRRHAAVVSAAACAGVLVALLVSGWSVGLRDAVSSSRPAATVALYAVGLGLLLELTAFPLAFYRHFVLDRRYGLSDVSLRSWLVDHVKAVAVTLVLGLPAAEIVYLTLRWWPERWWLASAAIFMAGLAILSVLAPILLMPLFYRVTPLDRESLKARLVSLSTKAGVRVLDVYQWGLREQTRRANAALVGSGTTRRILLSDTLLAEYSDDEIEVIIAHELGHHVHRDLSKTLLVECGLILLVFFGCAQVLGSPWLTRGLDARGDIAALPLLLLTSGAIGAAATPLMNALSRRNERRADRYALRLTGRRAPFISAMRRLADQNLAEPHPSRVVQWLFYTHPSVHERIQAARASRPEDCASLPG